MDNDNDNEYGYKTLIKQGQARFTEKKSEFIGTARPVSTEAEAAAFINEIKSLNRKATHNCCAYILRENNTAGHSDDGEPGGTAGVPIYEVIRKEGLTDTAIVVTRYFGGVLLGAGGLVRAYSAAAVKAVAAAGIKRMSPAEKLELCVKYSLYGRLASVFAEYGVITAGEIFTENVTLQLYIKENLSAKFINEITDVYNGKIVVNKLQKEMLDFG